MTTVRHYQAQDEKALRSIATENYIEQAKDGESVSAETPALQAYLKHIIGVQADEQGLVLVAEHENTLLGFVCLQYEDTYAFVSDLYVTPEHRCHGVGASLTESVEELAKKQGSSHIALRVEAENTNSRSFYSKKNYQEKFVVMSKALDE